MGNTRLLSIHLFAVQRRTVIFILAMQGRISVGQAARSILASHGPWGFFRGNAMDGEAGQGRSQRKQERVGK